MANIWIVPGAPLENGQGWRVWICPPGRADFAAPSVTVRSGSQEQPIKNPASWRLLPEVSGLNRRAGVLTIELQTPAPGMLLDVELRFADEQRTFRWAALPDKIDDQGVTFLFGSCFWQNNIAKGRYCARSIS